MSQTTFQYKLKLEREYSIDELKDLVARGARFVIFPYVIGAFIFSGQRFSNAYLILPSTNRKQIAKKYNLLTLCFGWIGFFYISESRKSIGTNNSGGLDITDDVILNLNENDLKLNVVNVEYTEELYTKPSKAEIKEFRRVFEKEIQNPHNLSSIVIGYYVNTIDGERPYFVIGYIVKEEDPTILVKMNIALKKRFAKHVRFEYLNLVENKNEVVQLLEQGITILDR